MTHKALLSCLLFYFFTLAIIYSQPDLTIIPFRIVKKAIIVQGIVDGQHGYLIIDTGIAKTLLNKTYFKNNKVFSNKDYSGFQSINNANQVPGIDLIILQLQDFSIKTSTNIFDLSHIEKQKGINILGIVGIDIFRKYELEIDFFMKEIRLYRLDKKGNRLLQEPQPMPSETLPFRYQGHLPCITANLHNTPLHLGLDTGAEANLLSSRFFKKSNNQSQQMQTKKLLDLNGKQITVPYAQIIDMQIGSLELPSMATVFPQLNTHYGGLDDKNIHGLLGYEFFRHHRTAINFKKQEVYLWDEHARENLPLVTGKN